jgi:HlyD family secretion protein
MKLRHMAAFLLPLLVLGCGRERGVAVADEAPGVETVVLEEKRVARRIECFGTIVFNKKVDVTSSIAGTVGALDVKEGQSVKAGQHLARLQNIQLELQLGQAQSRIDSARASLELSRAKLWEGEIDVEGRMISIEKSEAELAQKLLELGEAERSLSNKEELFAIGGVSEETIAGLRVQVSAARNECESLRKDIRILRIGLRPEDLASRGLRPSPDEKERTRQLIELNTQTLRAEVAVAEASLVSAERERKAAEAMVAELEIKAPAAGIIGGKYVERGEYVPEETKLFTVIDTSSVYAALTVQESEMPLLREGQDVELSIDALQARELRGRLESISPMADPQTGAFTVKAALPNRSGALKPGMFVRASIAYRAPVLAVLLPERCILQKKGSGAKVVAVVNGRAFMKDVTLGGEEDGAYVVERGLKAGEVLVLSPSPALREGMNVRKE